MKRLIHLFLPVLFLPILLISSCEEVVEGDELDSVNPYSENVAEFLWKWVDVSGPKPAPRADHSLAFLAPDRVLLFGGTDETQDFGDTWIFEVDQGTWREITVENGPFARCGMKMVYIGNQQVLMYGGKANFPEVSGFQASWIFDGRGKSCTQTRSLFSLPVRW